MANIQEIWRDIPNYEGYYQVSNLGRIKSLQTGSGSGRRKSVDGILSPTIKSNGYFSVMLYKDTISKRFHVHRLVGICFLGNSILQINHKDKNKLNNNVSNLEFVSNRFNTNHRFNNTNKSSSFRGITKRRNSFIARILVDRKRIYLGSFKNEKDASDAYENALNNAS